MVSVIAEKVSTAVELGDFNTRVRDYGDLYRLVRTNPVNGTEAFAALNATAAHRNVTLRPLSMVIDELPDLRQNAYRAWRARQGPAADEYPVEFADTVDLVVSFADPLLRGETRGMSWDAARSRWSGPNDLDSHNAGRVR